MENNEKTINEFWSWFTTHKTDLAPENISDNLISKLDHKILSLGDFSWEIREGDTEENMLIISPGGDVDLLPETNKVIKLAPKIENWEFCYYKPSKNWDFQLTLYEESNVKKILDVKDWEYVLYKFKDGTFDIIFKTRNLNSSTKEEQMLIADIVLESVIGEENSLRFIKKIEFVDEFNIVDKQKSNSIEVLKQHFDELVKVI
ncbi:hypothetical protein [Flavobacterium ajazii]|uniref:hypothetical protein n=1 Tax=Flavobacterium ajazii TaxID=2692318 RepID=UPI0013D3C1E6|nr:hypothetical protein [Flavobacterium ajazii]